MTNVKPEDAARQAILTLISRTKFSHQEREDLCNTVENLFNQWNKMGFSKEIAQKIKEAEHEFRLFKLWLDDDPAEAAYFGQRLIDQITAIIPRLPRAAA